MTVASSLYFQFYNSEGQVLEVAKEGADFVLGRYSKTGSHLADVFVDDLYASRRHCRIFRDVENAAQWLLEDLGSNNGTKLNGIPVTTSVPIHEDAWILIGTTRITVSQHPKVETQRQASTVDTLVGLGDNPEETIVYTGAARTNLPETLFSGAKPFPASDDATIVAAAHFAVPEGDATVVSTRPAVAAGMDDNSTVLNPQVMTRVQTTIAAADVRTLARTSEESHWNISSSSAVLGADPVAIFMKSKMIQGFLRANYLDTIQVAELLKMAQSSGQTFFRTMIHAPSVQKIMDVILASVSETFGWKLIQDREKLLPRAIETTWLPFGRAKEIGCVMLKPEEGSDGQVCYGTLDPFDLTLHDWVEQCSGAKAERIIVHPGIFYSAIQNLKGSTVEEGEGVVGTSIDFTSEDETHIRDQIQDVDVPQMVNYFLYRAQLQGASDIHIEPTEELLLVRLRVDGILHQEISLPMAFHMEVASRLKILSGMDVVERRRPQDGRLAIVIRNNPIDVRVSSYPTVFGEKFVLRLLDKNALRPSIETLGLMERDRFLLREKLAAPYGLVMISGPTGSGKTTTLYSCLGGMDRDGKNILTVEDPVEYRMAGVHQMQVNSKIGLTFTSGLRTILRQDPDVIMVGETRDSETAAMAVQASLTGHIVFSTIHTNDAVGVITRMLDMGIEPFLVSTALSLAVAQRLVRTICKHCRISVSGEEVLLQLQKEGITRERLNALGIHIDPNLDYTQGRGCAHCRDTGYHGRRAVFELFEMTDEARNLIMSGGINASQLKALAKKRGMTTLITHGVQLAEEEVTTFQEVLRVLGEES